MVQADPSRNYYADLGVLPNADDSEIKKAFRQLALKYHPDRNRGREEDFTEKFQQIQAAHEILTDKVQRQKYDDARKKYRPSASSSADSPRARPPPARYAYTTTPSGSYYRPTPPRPPPPQHHQTYTNGADRFTGKNFRPPPTAQRPSARHADTEKANVFTAWQKMKQPRSEEQRAKASSTNNPNGTPFGRSQSTRTPSKKGFDPATPGDDEGQARSSYRSTYQRPVPMPPPSPDSVFEPKGGTVKEDPPYAEGNRVRTPYASTAGERTSVFGDGVGRSASVRNSPTERPGYKYSSTGARPHFDHGPKAPSSSAQGAHGAWRARHMRSTKDAVGYSDSSSESSESEADVFRRGGGNAAKPSPRPSPITHKPRTPGPYGSGSNVPPPPPPPRPFHSKSEESINMKFSAADWDGTFQGKADYFAPTPQRTTGNSSPTRGRASQRTNSQRNGFGGASQPPTPVSGVGVPPLNPMPPPPPPPPPLNMQTPFPSGSASAPHSAKFAPEVWAETFKSPNWAFPPPKFGSSAQPSAFGTSQTSSKETSPRRGNNAARRSKPNARKASAMPPADTQSEQPKSKYQAFAEDAPNGDDDAMDIDMNTPPVVTPEPTRKDSDYTFKPGTPIKFGTPGAGSVTSPSGLAGTTDGVSPNGTDSTRPTTRDAQSSSGLNGLSGLRNVEPLAPSSSGAGLSGLEDLGDTLPFPSQASSSHPTKPNSAQSLKYPIVPIAPQPPPTLDEPSVRDYLTKMELYVKSWREYNMTMTKHFTARDAELNALDDHFILNRGEPTKKLGFASYMRKMKEDEKVIETWRYAQEMHIKAMQRCEDVRNRTMKYAGTGL
ncbi:hypothetical protein M011DRAFT_466019 [Sporormia fimetaria CBS 119925]|uniref:J domain-containing protein n=1 Tax=Sporormia fimetaria CBS 119925 TaxID=1340428 RepID=A0A6A6VIF5_9PLEO|nr:hypothetical protein M011DRAFT_466019 [Sporormia fimetaria CBS 119925]